MTVYLRPDTPVSPAPSQATVVEMHDADDLRRLPALTSRLEAGRVAGPAVIVDLGRTLRLDGGAAAMLLQAADAARARRLPFVLCAPAGGFARQVLALLRVSSRVPVVESRQAALAHLGLAGTAAGTPDGRSGVP
jgi:anti-anti-sigma regulatory factor